MLYAKSIINGNQYISILNKIHLVNKGLQSINVMFYYNEKVLTSDE